MQGTVTTSTGSRKTVTRSIVPRRERRGTRSQRVQMAVQLSAEANRR